MYWVIVGLAVMVVSPMLSIVASKQINEQTIQKTLESQEAAKEETRRESLVRYCALLGSQVDVYAEATTKVGRDARAVWLREYQRNGCQPPRR